MLVSPVTRPDGRGRGEGKFPHGEPALARALLPRFGVLIRRSRHPRAVMAGAKASAPGKVILFGEHAVVYGEPAIAVALSLRTEVALREAGDQHRVNGAPLAPYH